MPNYSIFEVSTGMNRFTGTVWKILRKKLRKYPYKPKTVQSLTDQHKLYGVQFRNCILQQNEEFCNNIMWSDEKQWVEKQHPNKQKEQYWANHDLDV